MNRNNTRKTDFLTDLEEMARQVADLGPPEPELMLDAPRSTLQTILRFPNPKLRQACKPVADDEDVTQLVSDMAHTMYATGGVGLAAPQVSILKRIFVMDIFSGTQPQEGHPSSQLLIAINPQIWILGSEVIEEPEGCLSFPGVSEVTRRAGSVALKAQDYRRRWYAMRLGGTAGRVIQHEYDHLNGKTLIDRIGHEARKRIRKQLRA